MTKSKGYFLTCINCGTNQFSRRYIPNYKCFECWKKAENNRQSEFHIGDDYSILGWGKIIVGISNAYSIREELKKKNFFWNDFTKQWEKNYPFLLVSEKIETLKELIELRDKLNIDTTPYNFDEMLEKYNNEKSKEILLH